MLKYPALAIIGGLSLAAAIAIGAVGMEVAGELLYKRLPFPEGGRIVRLETQDAAASRVEPRAVMDRMQMCKLPTALEGLARSERQRDVEVKRSGAGDGYQAWTDTDPGQRRHPPHQFILQQRRRVL